MFDTLSERLQAALSDVRSRGKLTEDDMIAIAAYAASLTP